MSCVLLWSAISRVAKQHISAWRVVVAVMLLGLTVVAGCDVRPFCELEGSCSSDGTDDGGDGGGADCINRLGEDSTIELASTPPEIDVLVGASVNVSVRVVTPVSGRTYALGFQKRPTSGQIDDASTVTNMNEGTMTFPFRATTSTEFTTDDIEISVEDSASEVGCLDITVRVGPAVQTSP